MNAQNFLLLLSGAAWTVVYIDSIHIGLRDKTYAMPFWVLALNLAWECLHAVLGFREVGVSLQNVINTVWFLFDLGLLYTYIRFGRKYFPSSLNPGWFQLWLVAGLLVAFVVQYAFILEFGLFKGATYSAFLQNLLMSVLFIVMLVQRGSSEGQSLLIAISKWIGTMAPTLLIGYIGVGVVTVPNFFVLSTGIFIAVFDAAYLWMLSRAIVRERQSSSAEARASANK